VECCAVEILPAELTFLPLPTLWPRNCFLLPLLYTTCHYSTKCALTFVLILWSTTQALFHLCMSLFKNKTNVNIDKWD
jgi:hypothetical protein